MKIKAKYDARIPAYALSYIINDDDSGLVYEEEQQIDAYLKPFYNEACACGGHVVIATLNDEADFSSRPAFGLPCDVVACEILIMVAEVMRIVPGGKNPIQARFWTYIRGAVRMKIREGQRLSWSMWERTDEGYHSEGLTFWIDGGFVYRESHHDGRDCDGRHSGGGIMRFDLQGYCEGVNVRHVDREGLSYPQWEQVEDFPVYDQYAQMAGY